MAREGFEVKKVLLFMILATSLASARVLGGEGFLPGEGPAASNDGAQQNAFNRMFAMEGGGAGDVADIEMVRMLLSRERNITIEEYGGKIVLDGRVTSEGVKTRIDKLRAVFKNLLDLTEYLQEEDSILADAGLIKKKIETKLNDGFESRRSFVPPQAVNFEVVNNDIIIMGNLNNEDDVGTAEQIAKTYNPKIVNHLMVRKQAIELAVIFAKVTGLTDSQIGLNAFNPTLVTLPTLKWAGAAGEGGGGTNFGNMFRDHRWTASELLINPNAGESSSFQFNAGNDNIEILARPHLTALNGTPARFVSGGERAITNVIGDTSTTEYKEYGLILEVTPTLTSDGRIHVLIKMSFLTPEGEDDFSKFEHNSAVIVAANQGLALSGLIREITSSSLSGVPGLRKVPLLRNFFSTRGKRKDNEELIVMVFPLMPTVVHQAPYMDSTDSSRIVDQVRGISNPHSYLENEYRMNVPMVTTKEFRQAPTAAMTAPEVLIHYNSVLVNQII